MRTTLTALPLWQQHWPSNGGSVVVKLKSHQKRIEGTTSFRWKLKNDGFGKKAKCIICRRSFQVILNMQLCKAATPESEGKDGKMGKILGMEYGQNEYRENNKTPTHFK